MCFIYQTLPSDANAIHLSFEAKLYPIGYEHDGNMEQINHLSLKKNEVTDHVKQKFEASKSSQISGLLLSDLQTET